MTKDVVVSVPHSGTRTLVKHLGIGHNSPRGRWMHFGYDPDEPRIKSGKYHLHIPIRHPLEVTKSWARRDKNINRLVEAYESMFSHLDQAHTFHKMEDLPKLDGYTDHPGQETPQWRLDKYEGVILVNVVAPNLEFFQQFYG